MWEGSVHVGSVTLSRWPGCNNKSQWVHHEPSASKQPPPWPLLQCLPPGSCPAFLPRCPVHTCRVVARTCAPNKTLFSQAGFVFMTAAESEAWPGHSKITQVTTCLIHCCTGLANFLYVMFVFVGSSGKFSFLNIFLNYHLFCYSSVFHKHSYVVQTMKRQQISIVLPNHFARSFMAKYYSSSTLSHTLLIKLIHANFSEPNYIVKLKNFPYFSVL